eukprot:03229.XXX_7551_7871_1 [CDS] Oithona nana genome sequencing.
MSCPSIWTSTTRAIQNSYSSKRRHASYGVQNFAIFASDQSKSLKSFVQIRTFFPCQCIHFEEFNSARGGIDSRVWILISIFFSTNYSNSFGSLQFENRTTKLCIMT